LKTTVGQVEKVAEMLQASPVHISEAVHLKQTAICGEIVAPKRSKMTIINNFNMDT